MKNYEEQNSQELEELLEGISITTVNDSDLFASSQLTNEINIQLQLNTNQFELLLQRGYSGQLQNVYYILRENNQVQLSANSIEDIHQLLSQVSSS